MRAVKNFAGRVYRFSQDHPCITVFALLMLYAVKIAAENGEFRSGIENPTVADMMKGIPVYMQSICGEGNKTLQNIVIDTYCIRNLDYDCDTSTMNEETFQFASGAC